RASCRRLRLALWALGVAAAAALAATVARGAGAAPDWVGTAAAVLGALVFGALMVLPALMVGALSERERQVFRRHLGHLTREQQEAFFLSGMKPDAPEKRRMVLQFVRELNLPTASDAAQSGFAVPAPDEPATVTALRREIVRAGHATYWLRIATAGV